MSQVHILAAHSPVNFGSETVSCSADMSSALSVSFNDKSTNTLIDRVLSSTNDLSSVNNDTREDFAVPGLPILHFGHPDIHLRNGVMNAAQLAADGEPDAEKAFFVADLSYVYHQHLRWKRLLPDVEPFYGKWLLYRAKLTAS